MGSVKLDFPLVHADANIVKARNMFAQAAKFMQNWTTPVRTLTSVLKATSALMYANMRKHSVEHNFPISPANKRKVNP